MILPWYEAFIELVTKLKITYNNLSLSPRNSLGIIFINLSILSYLLSKLSNLSSSSAKIIGLISISRFFIYALILKISFISFKQFFKLNI